MAKHEVRNKYLSNPIITFKSSRKKIMKYNESFLSTEKVYLEVSRPEGITKSAL